MEREKDPLFFFSEPKTGEKKKGVPQIKRKGGNRKGGGKKDPFGGGGEGGKKRGLPASPIRTISDISAKTGNGGAARKRQKGGQKTEGPWLK